MKEEYWTKRVLGFRHLEEGETQKLFPNFKYGWVFITAMIEGMHYGPEQKKAKIAI